MFAIEQVTASTSLIRAIESSIRAFIAMSRVSILGIERVLFARIVSSRVGEKLRSAVYGEDEGRSESMLMYSIVRHTDREA